MKTILLTGITRGLGKELFDQLTAKGYTVYGLLRDPGMRDSLQRTIPGNARLILADLSGDDCMTAILEAVGANAIDLVINNAGIGGRTAHLADVGTAEVMELFNVHCLGALRVVKAVSGNLAKSKKAIVINVNSRMGSITHQSIGTFKELEVSYSYRIAKAAQNMLTNCLRSEFGPEIQCVSLTPGRLKTALAQTDADLEPSESAARIIRFWEEDRLEALNGIVELPDKLLEW
jgi:NAD(P)-dependent dehydrogenase (short-subunit alcohol dehydrogenase family)